CDKDVREAFDACGVKPNIISAYVDDPAVISVVEHRVAATILSGLILKNRVSTAVIRPIDPPFYRTLGMAVAKNKALTPPLSRFMKIAEEVAKNFVI
ncbi:MAG: hypothetical protein MJ078_05775, partial [Clostridia bacterium]|nr:hypothetical protein [Clostridia bacterium]